MRDDPSLRGRPLAVGGRADHRGVIATCNYEARKFGIRSAMSTAQAIKRCPDLLVIPPAMEKYRIASRQILDIYRDYTALVEPLSLDEAYLDVSNATQCRNSATLIAQQIRERIRETVGITASAGIAPNKFLAKIASDWNKPDGQCVIRPQDVDAFVAELPVDKLFGVGRVTAQKLHKLGAHSCADLRAWSLLRLQQHFGKFGTSLYQLCRGIDHRAVNAERERKSISVEETYANDLPDLEACQAALPALIDELRLRIARKNVDRGMHKLFVKIRFSDFRRTTAECLSTAIDLQRCLHLLESAHARSSQAVRLLGVGIRLQEEELAQQAGLFDDVSALLPLENDTDAPERGV